MPDRPIPTLYEWIGGMPAIERLFDVFYAKVPTDPVPGPVFAKMSPDHVKHVSAFVAEVFGGPKASRAIPSSGPRSSATSSGELGSR